MPYHIEYEVVRVTYSHVAQYSSEGFFQTFPCTTLRVLIVQQHQWQLACIYQGFYFSLIATRMYKVSIYSVVEYRLQISYTTLHGERAAVEPYTTRKPLPSLLVWYTGCACWVSWFFIVVVAAIVIHHCSRSRRVYNAIDTVECCGGVHIIAI